MRPKLDTAKAIALLNIPANGPYTLQELYLLTREKCLPVIKVMHDHAFVGTQHRMGTRCLVQVDGEDRVWVNLKRVDDPRAPAWLNSGLRCYVLDGP